MSRAGDKAALCAAVVRTAQALDAAGFCPSKSGNVSVRHCERVLITPSGLPYAAMLPDDIVEIDLEGRRTGGSERKPSSEWPFHAAIYKARPDATAIVHTHSPYATALSCARRDIPALHYMIALGGGADIRCANYATFGTQALADNAVAALEGRRAVLLANHGVITIGQTLAGAQTLAGEVENLARQYLALLAAGLAPAILDAPEMERVTAQFKGYGRAV
ncbi:MAG TPA: class II aldolase/adducin family protein [Beijerinckiaceae bacterium]|nr:class II aldolase/adducin family protein [Beijerinckiaceae bacterium]